MAVIILGSLGLILVGGVFWIATQQGALNLSGPPDMEITMAAEPTTIAAGGSATYTLNYKNLGESPAGSVVLTMNMPEGVTIDQVVPSAVCRSAGLVYTCNMGTRQPDSTGIVTVSVTADSAASGAALALNSSITVSTTRDDKKDESNTANNVASATVTVQ